MSLLIRLFAVVSLLGVGLVHLIGWFDWARFTSVVGPMFLLNVAASVVLAIAVLVWRHWLVGLATLGFGAATLGAYVMSLTVGFFGVQEQFQTTLEVWGVVTDVAAILAGALLLLSHQRSQRLA
ncbi:hypothetical protein [Haloechinothrix halophila]|uniref:hypothetical protein n=1 Tax=Haloechinothrix halophila TaxID=1069073 RepID=UPI0004219880|nr:hypothetical protein [Haloechinothrix halophila]